jgi:hypothetical protein
MSFPPEGSHGRVDLWSVAEQRWYSQYVGIGEYGSYSADFGGMVDMGPTDLVRVWATSPDGTQQAALGWTLEVGTSVTDDTVWGYTTVSTTAHITLYRTLDGGSPIGVLGTADALVDATGFFSTSVLSQDLPVDIAPSHVLLAQAGEHVRTLYVGLIEMTADVAQDELSISGPPGVTLHLEGRRRGVRREDAPYQTDYVWREVSLGPDGSAVVDVSPFDVREADWFDLTGYDTGVGTAVHRLVAVPGEPADSYQIYLPVVARNWD